MKSSSRQIVARKVIGEDMERLCETEDERKLLLRQRNDILMALLKTLNCSQEMNASFETMKC